MLRAFFGIGGEVLKCRRHSFVVIVLAYALWNVLMTSVPSRTTVVTIIAPENAEFSESNSTRSTMRMPGTNSTNCP